MNALPRIDDEFLIHSVSYWPEIYDSRHEHYRNQSILYNVWKEVGRDMSFRVDDAIAGLECRERWKVLKKGYVRSLKQEETQQAKGVGRKRKVWPHTESMSFLKPFLGQSTNKKQKTTPSNSDAQDNSLSTLQDRVDSVEVPESKLNPFEKPPLSITDVASESVDNSTEPAEKDDDLFVFFKSLSSDVQKLSPKRQRTYKLRILRELNALIDEQEEEVAKTSTFVV